MKRNFPAIKINLLGVSCIQAAGKTLSFPYQKPKLLLAYLVTEARTVNRADLSAMLWPDRSEHHARQNLRQAMAALKRQLGESFDGLIATSRKSLEFIGQESCTIDIERLKNASTASHTIEAVPTLQSIYPGPFCEGVHVPHGDEFNGWLKLRRQEFHSMAITLGRNLVNGYRAAQQDHQVIQAYAQLLAIEWDNESLMGEFMKYLDTHGQRRQAINLFQEYEKRLRQEIGLQPGDDLLALHESIIRAENAKADFAFIG